MPLSKKPPIHAIIAVLKTKGISAAGTVTEGSHPGFKTEAAYECWYVKTDDNFHIKIFPFQRQDSGPDGPWQYHWKFYYPPFNKLEVSTKPFYGMHQIGDAFTSFRHNIILR